MGKKYTRTWFPLPRLYVSPDSPMACLHVYIHYAYGLILGYIQCLYTQSITRGNPRYISLLFFIFNRSLKRSASRYSGFIGLRFGYSIHAQQLQVVLPLEMGLCFLFFYWSMEYIQNSLFMKVFVHNMHIGCNANAYNGKVLSIYYQIACVRSRTNTQRVQAIEIGASIWLVCICMHTYVLRVTRIQDLRKKRKRSAAIGLMWGNKEDLTAVRTFTPTQFFPLGYFFFSTTDMVHF